MNERTIDTGEVAERVNDILDDLYNDQLINPTTYRKKSNFPSILRAINHADRQVCRDSQASRQVVVYVPEGKTRVLFNDLTRYEYLRKQNIIDQEIIDDKNWFINRDTHLYVLEILDRYLYVFENYPTDGERSTHRIRKVGEAEYNRAEHHFTKPQTFMLRRFYSDQRLDPLAYFSLGDQRLVLGQDFDGDVFLQFNARVMPGIVNVGDIEKKAKTSENYDIYRVVATHDAFEWLVLEAASFLLPVTLNDARASLQAQILDSRDRYLTTKPTERNVVVPRPSFG